MKMLTARNMAVFVLAFSNVYLSFSHIAHCIESNIDPDSFKHFTISERYEQIRYPYEIGMYTIIGAINTKAQIGGVIWLEGSFADYNGGYTIAYFVPLEKYFNRIESNVTHEQLVEGCTSTYTLRLFRSYVSFKSPQGSNFSSSYIDELRNSGIIELLFVPDIQPGLYCLVLKIVLQEPFDSLDGQPIREYMNLHYLLAKERFDNIEYEKRFTVQVEGSITDDILNMHSEGSVSNEHELLKYDANNDIGKDETRFTDSGSIRNYLCFLAFAFIVAFLCGYYCRNIRIRVAKRR